MYLFIFEFLGTNELLVVLVVALILLGPRKLPQMSRKIGKSLAEFKRTSEEFKRTWEKEVDLESLEEGDSTGVMLPPQGSILNTTIERGTVAGSQSGPGQTENQALAENVPPPTVTPIDPDIVRSRPDAASDDQAIPTPTRKRDWL